ncbi:hypothetical protein, partial [Candidatus Protofrankia datiscae]|uniref:hypothetical protein n=3 Tax=Protofrankia TaxID=2994361 RepID=UPI0019CFD6C4
MLLDDAAGPGFWQYCWDNRLDGSPLYLTVCYVHPGVLINDMLLSRRYVFFPSRGSLHRQQLPARQQQGVVEG